MSIKVGRYAGAIECAWILGARCLHECYNTAHRSCSVPLARRKVDQASMCFQRWTFRIRGACGGRLWKRTSCPKATDPLSRALLPVSGKARLNFGPG